MKKIVNAIIRWQIYAGVLIVILSLIFSVTATIIQGTFNGLSILPAIFIGFFFLIKWSAEILDREMSRNVGDKTSRN